MSTQTDKYGFVKPEITDPADITALNGNWDMVENELKNIDSKITSHTTTTNTALGKLQPKITYGTAEPSGGSPGDVYIQLLND